MKKTVMVGIWNRGHNILMHRTGTGSWTFPKGKQLTEQELAGAARDVVNEHVGTRYSKAPDTLQITDCFMADPAEKCFLFDICIEKIVKTKRGWVWVNVQQAIDSLPMPPAIRNYLVGMADYFAKHPNCP